MIDDFDPDAMEEVGDFVRRIPRGSPITRDSIFNSGLLTLVNLLETVLERCSQSNLN
jgi:hypothetical protein